MRDPVHIHDLNASCFIVVEGRVVTPPNNVLLELTQRATVPPEIEDVQEERPWNHSTAVTTAGPFRQLLWNGSWTQQ